MIRSHLLNLLVYAGIVSSVFAVLLRDAPKARLVFFLKCFGAFVGSAIAAAWLMATLPR